MTQPTLFRRLPKEKGRVQGGKAGGGGQEVCGIEVNIIQEFGGPSSMDPQHVGSC